MSLTLASLIPGLVLVAAGLPLLLAHAGTIAALKAFPRSRGAAAVCFGGGSLLFLWKVLNLSEADFGAYRAWLLIGFGLVAALSFKSVPDFLAVRGACVLMLLGAAPLLDATYMHYGSILAMKAAVYVGIALAIWLGAQPWRLRDFLEWLFARTPRARGLGGLLAAYGLVLCVLAFTY